MEETEEGSVMRQNCAELMYFALLWQRGLLTELEGLPRDFEVLDSDALYVLYESCCDELVDGRVRERESHSVDDWVKAIGEMRAVSLQPGKWSDEIATEVGELLQSHIGSRYRLLGVP